MAVYRPTYRDPKTGKTKKATRSRNPRRAPEDEADYRFSQKSIKSGKPIPLSKVLDSLTTREK
jgi:hypothetical protein